MRKVEEEINNYLGAKKEVEVKETEDIKEKEEEMPSTLMLGTH